MCGQTAKGGFCNRQAHVIRQHVPQDLLEELSKITSAQLQRCHDLLISRADLLISRADLLISRADLLISRGAA